MLAAQREAQAGLSVLRLLDRMRVSVPREERPTVQELRSVQRMVADTGPSLICDTLDSVLAALTDACIGRRPFVAVRLLAYARVLLNGSRWAQAADVYQTFIAHAATPDDFKWVSEAYQRLAYALRMLGAAEGALAACRTGQAVANSMGDVAATLKLRISEASIEKHREGGGVDKADAILLDVIRRAEHHRLPVVRAFAVHDRGSIAYERGNLQDAVAQFYEAWQTYSEPIAKDRALADLALVLGDVGLRDAARDAFLIISGTAVEAEARMIATLNLLDLAARDGHEPVFEQYRQALLREPMSARVEVRYHVTVAEGLERFGRVVEAKAANAKAASAASQHGLDLATLQLPTPVLPPVVEAHDDLRFARVVRALEVATGTAGRDRARAP
jgi:tetratricopeptide (TPR) repeat protein